MTLKKESADVRWNKFIASLSVLSLAVVFCGCAAIQAQRQAEAAKQQQFVKRVDLAHVWVTAETPGQAKPYTVLGNVKYAVPFSPDAIDSHQENDQLKKMAYAKWPNKLDALVNEKETISDDGSKVSVSAEAIEFASSTDRQALHNMNNGLVVSPSAN